MSHNSGEEPSAFPARRKSMYAWAQVVKAGAVRAESGRSQAGLAASARGAGLWSGSARSSAWALVPPHPNELTPAKTGPRPFRNRSSLSGILILSFSKSIFGFGCVKCRLGGIWRLLSARATLMMPAIPAAGSR